MKNTKKPEVSETDLTPEEHIGLLIVHQKELMRKYEEVIKHQIRLIRRLENMLMTGRSLLVYMDEEVE